MLWYFELYRFSQVIQFSCLARTMLFLLQSTASNPQLAQFWMKGKALVIKRSLQGPRLFFSRYLHREKIEAGTYHAIWLTNLGCENGFSIQRQAVTIYCSVPSKWEISIKMRAAFLALSFLHNSREDGCKKGSSHSDENLSLRKDTTVP